MEKVKKHDFIEIDYIGKTKDDDVIFDTTNEKIAKQHNIYNQKATYKPIVICVGERQIIKGLDNALIGKEVGKTYVIEIKPEDGFGHRDPKLVQLIQTSKFFKQNIVPVPGLQVNIDGIIGTIKSVGGGRTLVDFNHPLAGRELVYEVKINKLIVNNKEKIKNFLKLETGVELKNEDIDIEGNIALIKVRDLKLIKEDTKKRLKDILKLKEIKLINKNTKENKKE